MVGVESAAARLSAHIKTDGDFRQKLGFIRQCKQSIELMELFLNLRMEVDPDQVFRVLQLTSALTGPVKS